VKTLREMAERSRYFFEDELFYEAAAVTKHVTAESRELLSVLASRFGLISDWNAAALHQCLHDLANERGLGLGKIAQPLRVALTGSTVSPPIDATLELIGRDRVLARLKSLPIT
jgi:glutamyl-tRNA synthetase